MAVAFPTHRTKHRNHDDRARTAPLQPAGASGLELPSAWLVAGRSAAALALFVVAVVGLPAAAVFALSALL